MEQPSNPAPGEFPQDRCSVEGNKALLSLEVGNGSRCDPTAAFDFERRETTRNHISTTPVLGAPLSHDSIFHRLCKARVRVATQRREQEAEAVKASK